MLKQIVQLTEAIGNKINEMLKKKRKKSKKHFQLSYTTKNSQIPIPNTLSKYQQSQHLFTSLQLPITFLNVTRFVCGSVFH